MGKFKPRHIWLGVAVISAGLVAASLLLTAWLNLHPCPLCIFQRLLFMIMSVSGACGLPRLQEPRRHGWPGF